MIRRHREGVAGFTAWLLIIPLITAAFVVAPPAQTPAKAQNPSISVSKDAPERILAGENATYSITVTNTGDERENNISISDVLPLGATFAGGVSPASAGSPSDTVDPATGSHVLVWQNLTDLAPGGSFTLTFEADPGPDGDTVGNVILNTAHGAASTDPREVPDFDGSGVPIDGSFTESATAELRTTVEAIEVTKSNDNSPEGELLRGVHLNRSTYTLSVRTAPAAGTDDLVVVDYLPDSLEFLGCGDVDNSQTVVEEYPSSGPLGSPALTPDPCPVPVSVETVTDPPADNGVDLPPGVYTKVTWDLGALPADTTAEIKYVAGIPLKRNTATWTGAEPAPESGEQAANLDNNNGGWTTEQDAEEAATNRVIVAGQYTGPTADGDPTTVDDDTNSVTIEDVRMRKSVAPANPAVGTLVSFTMLVETSEYMTGNGIVVTDALPDPFCPVAPGQNYDPGGAPECADAGSAPTIPFASVTPNSTTGGYDIVFDPLPSIPAQGSFALTFDAFLRTVYNEFGPRTGQTVVAGDSATNRTALTGSTTPGPDTGEPGADTVTDDSSATVGSGGPSINKQMKPRTVPVDCDPAVAPGYANSDSLTPEERAFVFGDWVCFKVRVDFPDDIATKNLVVTDFVPLGSLAVPGTFVYTDENTTAAEVTYEVGQRLIQAVIGVPDANGDHIVPPGGVFEGVFAVEVVNPADPPDPDLTGNLVKAVYSDTEGNLFALRDAAGYVVVPPSNTTLTKGVLGVDVPASGPNPPNVDGSFVQQQSVATFRIDISNAGVDGLDPGEFGIQGVHALDILPPGIDCTAIGNYRFDSHAPTPNDPPVLEPLPAGIAVCTNPGQGGHPDIAAEYGDSDTQSVISWTFPRPDDALTYSIEVGETMTLTYDMALPAQASVSTRYDNSAGVVEFSATTNRPSVLSRFFPADNISAGVPAAVINAPAADDPSYVVTADPIPVKAQTTAIDEENNNVATQATIGEEVTYTVSATIPAQTTVFNAVLSDPLPRAGSNQWIELLEATQSGPAGPTLEVDTATHTARLVFPPTYNNNTDAPQVFTMTITGRVTTLAGNVHGAQRTNTVSFTSNATLGGAALPPVTDQTVLTVVEPAPTLSKTVTPTVGIGLTRVVYTLTANNGANRPPMHDSVVIDCIPPEITFDGVVSTSTGTASIGDGDGANGCPAGTSNRLQWQVGDLAPGSNEQLQYAGILIPEVIAGTTLPNTATLTGSTLATGADVAYERTYSVPASASVFVFGGTTGKTVTPERATIGQEVTYTVIGQIPANVNFYEVTLLDTLPDGLDPSVTDVTLTCASTDLAACADVEDNPGYGTQLTPNGQQIGFYVGDVPTSPSERTFTATYSTVVLNDPVDAVGPPNQAGATPTNLAQVWWSTDQDAPTPDSVDDPPAAQGATSGPEFSATLTLIEPRLTIVKAVDNPTPQPGDTFTYSVTVANPTGTFVSEAFEVAVTDAVPVGVVVGSISNGGILTGDDPVTGGGTITWDAADLGSLAPGASVTLTYSATLAPSEDINATPLTNTAAIDSYFSLPAGNDERRAYSGPTAQATVTPQFPEFTTAKDVAAGNEAFIGQPFSWTITVTNTGGGDGRDVDVTDTLPTNFCYDNGSATVSIAGGPATPVEPALSGPCAGPPVNQTLTWTDLGDLAPGQSLTITLATTPTTAVINNPGVGTPVPHTNTAQASGDDATGSPQNADGSYSGGPDTAVAVIAEADLEVTKDAVTTPIPAGTQGQYTVTVANLGPDPALAPFHVEDRLPAGVTFVSAEGSGWTCAESALIPGVINCTAVAPAALAPGASLSPITVTIQTPSNAPDGTIFTNVAEASSSTLDTNPANNTDDAFIEVIRDGDVGITKTTQTDPIVPGEPVTYTLDVVNNGPSISATPITVTDDLPAGLTGATVDGGAGWDCSASTGTTVNCVYLQDLPATAGSNTAPTITVTADLDPAFTGTACPAPSTDTDCLVNTAVVTPTTVDSNPANNTSTVDDPVTPQADVAITKSTTTNPVVTPGEELSYQLDVRNNGPSVSVAPITVTDTLDPALTLVDVGGTDWDCSASAGQDVVCVYGDDLTVAQDAAPITVTVLLAPSFTGDLPNTAVVTPTTPDPDTSNNDDDVLDPTVAEADVQIVKTTRTPPVVPGQDVTYWLDVSNNGPSDSQPPITVTDELDPALTLVSVAGDDWDCSASAGQDVSCAYLDVLAAGDAAPTIVLTVALDPGFTGDLTNTAVVTPTTEDTDPDNNTSTVVNPAEPQADLAIVKETVTAPIVPGRGVEYSLAVTNNGPSNSVAPITVTDTLDPSLTLLDAAGTAWDCSASAGQQVVCVYTEDLGVGKAAPLITVVTNLDPAFTGVACPPPGTGEDCLPNTAVVTGITPDPNPDNNTSQVVDPVVPQADVAIVKSTVTQVVLPGREVTYELQVSNNGPSTSVTPITVTDTLDPALTLVSVAGGPVWDCGATAGQDVSCTYLDDLGPGVQAPPIVLTAALDPRFEGTQCLTSASTACLVNTAVVTPTTPDLNPDNNTSSVDDPVQPEADLEIDKQIQTSPIVPGQDVTYTLAVTNHGPSFSRAPITVNDVLDPSLTLVSVDGGPFWDCSASTDREVVCVSALVGIPVDETAPTITLVAALDAGFHGDLPNTATVTPTTPDPDLDNNTDTVIAPGPPLVDLAIDKQAVGDFFVGGDGTFMLTVTNNGPHADPGPVTVVDTLPAGLTYVSAAGAGWTCGASGQVVTCTWPGEFAVGQVSQIELVVAVGSQAAPSVTNPADVSSASDDSDPSNNHDEASVTVIDSRTTPATGADVLGLAIAALVALAVGLLLSAAAARKR